MFAAHVIRSLVISGRSVCVSVAWYLSAGRQVISPGWIKPTWLAYCAAAFLRCALADCVHALLLHIFLNRNVHRGGITEEKYRCTHKKGFRYWSSNPGFSNVCVCSQRAGFWSLCCCWFSGYFLQRCRIQVLSRPCLSPKKIRMGHEMW